MERRDVIHPDWMYSLDFFFNKVIPKKFIVFVIGTIAMFLTFITGTQWLILAGAYGGLMYAQKFTQGLNNGNRSNNHVGRGSGDIGLSSRRADLDDKESRDPLDEN